MYGGHVLTTVSGYSVPGRDLSGGHPTSVWTSVTTEVSEGRETGTGILHGKYERGLSILVLDPNPRDGFR